MNMPYPFNLRTGDTVQVENKPIRVLKIEAGGDPWQGSIKPKIRLMGRWLERAGFQPGHRVEVTCVAPGVMELRFTPANTAEGTGADCQ